MTTSVGFGGKLIGLMMEARTHGIIGCLERFLPKDNVRLMGIFDKLPAGTDFHNLGKSVEAQGYITAYGALCYNNLCQDNFKNFRVPFCDQPLVKEYETWENCVASNNNSDLALFKSMVHVTDSYRKEDERKKKKNKISWLKNVRVKLQLQKTFIMVKEIINLV